MLFILQVLAELSKVEGQLDNLRAAKHWHGVLPHWELVEQLVAWVGTTLKVCVGGQAGEELPPLL